MIVLIIEAVKIAVKLCKEDLEGEGEGDEDEEGKALMDNKDDNDAIPDADELPDIDGDPEDVIVTL